MKKRLQGILIGFMAAIFLSGVTVWAAARTENISVVFSNIQLYVHGVSVTPRDAAGAVVEPFIFNGTTYLPVRAVADALDLDVHWDAATSSIWLGERPDRAFMPVLLWEQPYIAIEHPMYFRRTGTVNDNRIHLFGRGHQDGNNVTYALNMLARSFTAELYTDGPWPIIVRVFGDDRILFESVAFNSQNPAMSIDVDVTGVVALRLQVSPVDQGGGGYAIFRNATIITQDY